MWAATCPPPQERLALTLEELDVVDLNLQRVLEAAGVQGRRAQPLIEQWFRDCDLDRDGHLSAEELDLLHTTMWEFVESSQVDRSIAVDEAIWRVFRFLQERRPGLGSQRMEGPERSSNGCGRSTIPKTRAGNCSRR